MIENSFQRFQKLNITFLTPLKVGSKALISAVDILAIFTDKYTTISVGTSSGSSSFTARFHKGSLKVSKARARLDHKIAKLELEMFGTSLIFVLKSLNKARSRLDQSLGSA